MSYLSAQSRSLSFNDLRTMRSPEDLFALALAVEREGVHRYDRLASQMDQAGRPDLAALFTHLRDEEMGHEQSLETLVYRGGLGQLPALSFRWDTLPEGVMPPDLANLTPQQALRYALHNEQRTYALFLRVAANTHIAEIRHHAEALAAEELEHVALLARQGLSLETPERQPHPLKRLEDVLSLAASEAHTSAGRRRGFAHRLRALGDGSSARLMQDLAEDAEARCRDLGHSGSAPNTLTFTPANDTARATEILQGEATLSFATFQGFARTAAQLPPNGLSSLVHHEANLRLAAVARLEDRIASLSVPHHRHRIRLRAW